jgi:hypothetical protein
MNSERGETLYTLVHRDTGPVRTFCSREEAEEELRVVLRDEPTWAGDLWVEAFELRVAG